MVFNVRKENAESVKVTDSKWKEDKEHAYKKRWNGKIKGNTCT